MLGRLIGTAAGVAMRTEPLRIFVEVGRHPRLLRAWLPLSGMLLYRGRLPRQDTELVILRTAWSCRCRYEWVQHARLAPRVGLDEAAIAAVAEGAAAPAWSARQRALLAAVDELHRDHRLGPARRREVGAHLDDREVIELCALVGAYEMLAMILLTGDVQPEPRALAALPPRLRELGEQLSAGLLSPT